MKLKLIQIDDQMHTTGFSLKVEFTEGDYKITKDFNFDGAITKKDIVDFIKDEAGKIKVNIGVRSDIAKNEIGKEYTI
jgi:hypothetical protein